VESLNFKYLIGTEFSSDFINRFSHEVQKIFGQHYAQTNQSPYLRLILASAEDIAEEPEAALKELNDWLVVLEKIQVESPRTESNKVLRKTGIERASMPLCTLYRRSGYGAVLLFRVC